MAFNPDELPARIGSRDLTGLLSIRNDKLTYLDEGYVCVARSGDDPRGWRKPVDERANGTGPWQHFRPPCDRLLRSAEVYDQTRSLWLEDLRLEFDLIIDSQARRAQAPLWSRGRPVFKSLRKREDWDNFSMDVEFSYRDIERVPIWEKMFMLQDRDEDYIENLAPQNSIAMRYLNTPAPLSDSFLRYQQHRVRRLVRLSWIKQWVSHFPQPGIEFLESHQFSNRRWHLLNLWIRVPNGRSRFGEQPQLAWLLASSWNVKRNPVQRPFRSIRSLAGKSDAKILEWLDLPGEQQTIQILERIDPGHLSTRTVYWLKHALRNRRSRCWLERMDGPLGGEILYLLGRNQPISFPVAQAIQEKQTLGKGMAEASVSSLYFNVRKMLRQLKLADEISRLRAIDSPETLRAWHDHLKNLMRENRMRQRKRDLALNRPKTNPSRVQTQKRIEPPPSDWVDEGEFEGMIPNLFQVAGDPF